MSSLLQFFNYDFFEFVLNSFAYFFVGLIALCFLLIIISDIVYIGRRYHGI